MEAKHDSSAVNLGQQASEPTEQRDANPGSWRRWVRAVFYVLYGLVVVIATPLVILDMVDSSQGDQSLRTILAGVAFFAMVISLAISTWGIINHIVCYTRPALQKYIGRILLVVPIFELTSWFMLRFPRSGIYLESVRQLYQAFIVYNYVSYLLAFFEEVPNFENRLTMKPPIGAPRPFCLVKAIPSQRLIRKCKYAIYSYKIIRIIFTIVSFITYHTKTFKEGQFSPDNAYLWIEVFLTASQIWAMFCLNLLRKVTYEELQMLPKSTSQFIGVKLALFFDNFQSIFLHLLATFGVIKSNYSGFVGDAHEFASMLQNFLLCFEMVLVALLFNYAFDSRRYDVEGQPRLSFAQSFKQLWGVPNVISNVIGRLGQRGDHSNGDCNQQQTTADSPAAQQNGGPPEEEVAESPRKRKAGHQFISMPDIILNHMDDSDHAAVIHSPRNQDSGNHTQDSGVLHPNRDESNQVRGIENPMFQVDTPREDPKATDDKDIDDGFRDDVSRDIDIFLDEEFLTDDDDDDDDSDIDNTLSIGGRLDVPQPQMRRVKKVSYAGMTFDDLDLNKLQHPSRASPVVTKKQVKKVSYAGMTFEDMDWEQIRSHRSPTMDSEMAHDVSSIVEQNEERYSEDKEGKKEGKQDGEGFGSSEA